MEEMSETHRIQKSLIEEFKTIEDPRISRTRYHELSDILVIAISTLLCAGTSFYDMEEFGRAKEKWFRTFLKLPNGIPSHDTFNRVFALIDPASFHECFMRWTQSVRELIDREIIAVDGKALRAACQDGGNVRYIVNAWATSNRLVLGQLEVPDKTNEITAVPTLLRALELGGCIVSTDAMGCQKEIAREIIEADADYVLALKGNHATVHEEVKSFLDAEFDRELQSPPAPKPSSKKPPVAPTFAFLETADKGHGRLEIRRYFQSIAIDWFEDISQWEGLQSVGMVESSREIKGQISVERRYFLSSLPLDVKLFAQAVRGHWGVENSCHWVLDVVLREDSSRARSANAAENLATLRRLALNLLSREKSKKRSIKTKQLVAAWDHDFLLHLLNF